MILGNTYTAQAVRKHLDDEDKGVVEMTTPLPRGKAKERQGQITDLTSEPTERIVLAGQNREAIFVDKDDKMDGVIIRDSIDAIIQKLYG